jgi:hypothetical protein
VKTRNEEYLAAHRAIDRNAFLGMRSFNIIKTGEQDFCMVGECGTAGTRSLPLATP